MYKYETQYNSPNYTKASDCLRVFGHRRVVRSITVHHWDDPARNPTYSGTISWLTNPNVKASIHYVCEAGRVAHLVDNWNAAWHAGNSYGSATSLGIEGNPRASKGDIETMAELIADIRNHYGDLIIYAHNYWTSTACPGRYDVHELDRKSYEILAKKYGKKF